MQQPPEPDRLVGEVGAQGLVAIRGEVALVEDQEDHRQHPGQPLADVALRRHAIGDVRGLDLGLGTGDPLRHRRLLHEERAGDLGDGEPADQPQRQGNSCFRGERGVAAGEDQPQPVVLHRPGGDGRAVVAQPVCRLLLHVAAGLASQPVDGSARGGGGEPAAGVGRYAVPGPPLDRRDPGVGRRLLGEVEVTEAACERGDDPRPLLAVGAGDRLVDRGYRHPSSISCTDSSVWKGRTSTLPRQALDPSAARASASSRSRASITQKPPRCSLASR